MKYILESANKDCDHEQANEVLNIIGKTKFIIAQQNAGEGPGLLRGLSGVPGSGKFNFLSGVFGFKKPGPSAPRWPFFVAKLWQILN